MTIKEIAKLAGVSISTVSKIVNDKDQHINPKTRAKVLQIVKEYNYTPYGSVKNISTSRTFLLGILLAKITPFTQMIRGILQTAQANGYSIILLDSQGDSKLELKHITTLCKNRVDGVIWELVGEESSQYLHYFSEQDIPVCNINNDHVGSSYKIDFIALGYALTQKLIDYKHTRIACLLNDGSQRSAAVLEGYKRCLFDNQITFDQNMQILGNSSSTYRELLECHATGVISSHYFSLFSICTQLKKLHYDIPEDLSVVSLKEGFADQFLLPHISGITIPYYAFGSYVCKQLIAMCEEDGIVSDGYTFTPDIKFDTVESISLPSFLCSKKIVVIGSINTDFTFNVDHIPQSGKTTTILNSITSPGGKGVNQAVGVARFGRQVALIGEIGNDTYSPYIMDLLEEEHVSTQGIHKDMSQPTGTAYIYIEKDGNSTITIQAGANNKLLPKRIQNQRHLFEKAGYCLLSTEIPMETILDAAIIAKEHDVKTILKPATIRELPEELYKKIDILVPNDKESSLLCPSCKTIEERAQFLLEKGIQTVIITLGHKGCYLRTADTAEYFPASDFTAMDTTGGADAFISALATYLLEGHSLKKAVRIATYAAGFCISRQGVVSGLVDRNTLEAYIAKIEPELL